MDEIDPRPPSPSQLSKTPSWISLGFVLGALFVWLLPRPEPPAAPAPTREPAAVPLVATRTQPDFSEIEAVFSAWDRFAVWDHDLTEVALWDVGTRQYSRFYEVLHTGDNYYYRSLTRLTRPVLTHGVDANAPLLFTEPEARRQEWLHQRDEETWKSVTNSIARPAPPASAVPAAPSP
ncbi:MAG: hypothetical protein ACHQ4G_05045 [Opitutales bacterium]